MIETTVTGLDRVEVIVIREGVGEADVETVPSERELVFTVNGVYQARFCCAPHRIKSLVAGWLVAEGVINDFRDFVCMETDLDNSTVDIRVTEECFSRLEMRVPFGPITMLGDPPFERRTDTHLELAPAEVIALASKFRKLFRSLHSDERMCYLSAIANREEILAYGEGFHRVNSLLRAVGEVVLNGQATDGKVALMNFGPSRHIVAKLARAGVSMALCFAPPTTGAIEMGNDNYLTLLTVGNGNTIRVYSSPWRVI